MLELDVFLLFFTTSVILGLAPGPDNIFVLAQSALRGPKAGIAVTLGLCTGLLVHTTAVAFGVAAIFQASAMAFTVLKLVGAAYLIYLAWQAFHASRQAVDPKVEKISLWMLYRRGIIMNITNPKVSIFFLAFLPQFADPSQGNLPAQLLLLGGIFIFATILVFGTVSLMAGAVGDWLGRSIRAQMILNRIAGTVFVALALKLATTER